MSSSFVVYGKDKIGFSIAYVPRKTMEIAVHPDGRILVKAPLGTKFEEINERVLRRIRWIKRQLNYFLQYGPKTPKRRYVGGETHYYLGKQYRLKIIKSKDSAIKLIGRYIHVYCLDRTNTQVIKTLLNNWYRDHAKIKLPVMVDMGVKRLIKFGIKRPEIRLKSFGKQWGSYIRKGRMWLNVDLIKAPPACIEYVITHELCHQKEHNHSKEFFRLLNKIMPDWQKEKRIH